MRAKAVLISLLAILGIAASAQRPTIELTFTAIDNADYVQLDSIKVMNLTQGGDTVLYWPDTALSISYVGIPEISDYENAFQVFQNYPNPVTDQSTISMFVPEKDNVSMIVTDMPGRIVLKYERVLDKGIHSFRFTSGSGNLYFFTAYWKGSAKSIKILQAGLNSGRTSSLEYISGEDSSPQLKAKQAIQSFFFSPGDELLCIGYANSIESGMLDIPEESHTCTFQFATNIPCPGMPTVEYEGQVYNTIQIFSQCWLKENLNVGEMIPGIMEQSNNGTIEKYCYNNESDSCDKYGGLYQWTEMMQYTTQPGNRGICPPGWHLPTDGEWKVLEGAVDSQYGIGESIWNGLDYRGFNAGINLKSQHGWSIYINGTDLFGFTGLPGGFRFGLENMEFSNACYSGNWWTSSINESGINVWGRGVYGYDSGSARNFGSMTWGFSVRCIRDE